jgi:cystine transport system substrate-binding protein
LAVKKLLFVLGLSLLAGCTTESPAPVLRIASDATFAPFHLVDESGNPTGFDIELARAVATQAGFSTEVIVLPYDDLFSGLVAKTHDLVAATTGITPERQQLYLFTQPYFETCQVAVVRAGPGEPTKLTDLTGRRVGAGGTGTSKKAMQSIDADHVSLDGGQGVPSLEADVIDAWIVDEFDGIVAVRESGGRLGVLPEPVALEYYGFVLANDRADLKAKLDQGLAELEKNGELSRLRAEFGVERGPEWPVSW